MDVNGEEVAFGVGDDEKASASRRPIPCSYGRPQLLVAQIAGCHELHPGERIVRLLQQLWTFPAAPIGWVRRWVSLRSNIAVWRPASPRVSGTPQVCRTRGIHADDAGLTGVLPPIL